MAKAKEPKEAAQDVTQDTAKPKKSKKKEMILSALLSAFFLATAGVLLVYSHFRNWTPFESVNAQLNKQAQHISVDVKTTVPVKVKVEYGTSDAYLNSTEVVNEYKKTHNVIVPGVLVHKKHFIRVVAYTDKGKEYTSAFYTVE